MSDAASAGDVELPALALDGNIMIAIQALAEKMWSFIDRRGYVRNGHDEGSI
jgi:hypothetical protein